MDFDGNLDPSFGQNGIADIEYGSNERPWSIHLTDSGKILCLGWRHDISSTKLMLVMLNSDGSKDIAFGIDRV